MVKNINDLSIKTRQAIADKANASGMTAEQVKAQLNNAGITETNPVNIQPAQTELEAKIKSGNFSATDASAYNKMTGNNEGARNLMLGSQEAMINPNVKTEVNTQDLQIANNAGVKTLGENITVAPEVKKEAPIPKTETSKIEAPITTDLSKIQTVEDWKKQTGGGINNLESWIETKYNTVATQNPDGSIKATIGDKSYQWTIDNAGNPIKTEIQISDTEKQRINNFTKYSNLSDDMLSQSIVSGLLLPGTQAYNDLMADPIQKTRLDKIQKINLISGKTPDIIESQINASDEILNNNKVTIEGQTMTLGDAMKDGFIDQNEYNSITNNPEIIAKAKQVEEETLKYNDLKAKYDSIEDEVEEELKGTGATTTRKAQIIANRQKSLLGPLNLTINNLNAMNGTLTQMKQDSTALFTTNLGLYTKAEQRTYEKQQAQKRLEAKFNYEYGDLNSTNPQIQKVAAERIAQAIQTQYAGMPFRRDVSTMGADILNELKSGKTIEQITKDITSNIQNAPTYNQWAISKGLIAKPETIKYGFTEMGGNLYKTDDKGNISLAITGPTKYTKLDDGTYQDNNGKIITKSEIEQQKLLGNNYLNAKVGTNVGIECGQYARNATGLTATPGGNSLSDRIAKFNDTTPAPGGMVLFNGGGYDKTYGHIAVVTGINTDGTINIKESNLNGDNKVTERTIPLKGSNISGFYNTTPLAGGGKTGEVSQAAQDWGQNILSGKAKLSDITGQPELKTEVSSYLANAKVDLKPGDKMYEKIKDQKNTLDSLIKNETLAEDVSGGIQFSPFDSLTGNKQQYLRKIQFLLDGEVLQNLIDVKSQGATFGALSDREGMLLQKSASLLNSAANRDENGVITGFTMGETEFKKSLKDLQDSFEKALKPATNIENKTQSSTGKIYTW